jgi:hypothetical protein
MSGVGGIRYITREQEQHFLVSWELKLPLGVKINVWSEDWEVRER